MNLTLALDLFALCITAISLGHAAARIVDLRAGR